MFALVVPGYFCKFLTIVFNNYATDDTMMQKHHHQDKERHENAINRQQEKFSGNLAYVLCHYQDK